MCQLCRLKVMVTLNHRFVTRQSNTHVHSLTHRHGLSLRGDIKTLFDLLRLFTKRKPSLVLAHGIKLVIWGGISARIRRIPFYALITGLGFAFQGTTFRRKLLTKLVSFLYRIALKNSKAVI